MTDPRDERADAREEDARDLMRRTAGAADAGGATAGAHAGAIAGAAAGPAGVAAGGIAGGLAGWLAGSRARDAEPLTEEQDRHYRSLHERETGAELPYDHVRDLYRLGLNVARHPEYGRSGWQAVEPELRDAWTAIQRENWGEWQHASKYVRRGYEHTPE